ncbi:hypothetical protein LH19_01545 [Sphingopyxis macrogoltabida]|nr:hypothetical protein LH19_01545 [Sphingopyxis macrogoltabida]
MIGGYIDTMFVERPYQLRCGLRALPAEAVDIFDDQHLTLMQAVPGFEFEIVKGSAFEAIGTVKCAAAFVRDFLFDLPTHARGIFAPQVFLAIGTVALDLFRGGNSKVKDGGFHPYGFAARG